MQRNEYRALRDRYTPASVKLVVVAESPPAPSRSANADGPEERNERESYFYKPGSRHEPLFTELMKLAGLKPLAFASKEDGLHEFARRGWILVDATYQPVNDFTDSGRDETINRDYPLLRADLEQITPDRSAPLVLIKANVCRILEPKLVQDGFNVLNRGIHPPFPLPPFHQIKFRERFRTILERARDEIG